jgi:hypothetical protein
MDSRNHITNNLQNSVIMKFNHEIIVMTLLLVHCYADGSSFPMSQLLRHNVNTAVSRLPAPIIHLAVTPAPPIRCSLFNSTLSSKNFWVAGADKAITMPHVFHLGLSQTAKANNSSTLEIQDAGRGRTLGIEVLSSAERMKRYRDSSPEDTVLHEDTRSSKRVCSNPLDVRSDVTMRGIVKNSFDRLSLLGLPGGKWYLIICCVRLLKGCRGQEPDLCIYLSRRRDCFVPYTFKICY